MFLWSIVGYGYSYQAVSVTDLFTQKDRYNIFLNLVPINSSPCCHGHPLSRFLKWMKPLLFSTTNQGILYISPSSLRQQSRNRISWLILMREEGLLILTDFSTLWCFHNQFKAHFPFLPRGVWEWKKQALLQKQKLPQNQGHGTINSWPLTAVTEAMMTRHIPKSSSRTWRNSRTVTTGNRSTTRKQATKKKKPVSDIPAPFLLLKHSANLLMMERQSIQKNSQ